MLRSGTQGAAWDEQRSNKVEMENLPTIHVEVEVGLSEQELCMA